MSYESLGSVLEYQQIQYLQQIAIIMQKRQKVPIGRRCSQGQNF